MTDALLVSNLLLWCLVIVLALVVMYFGGDPSVVLNQAGNMAPAQTEQSTATFSPEEEKLKEFIPDPVVSVIITDIEGSRVYLLGKVYKPGPVVLTAPTTAMQALSQAGGLDKFADADAIRIIRGTGKDQHVIPLKYNQLIKGNDLSQDIGLKAGDMILVP